MFGIQTSEMLVIALIGILLFGPEKVPEFFHRAGQFMSKLQRSADDLWTSLQTEMNQARKPLEELSDEIKSIGIGTESGDEEDGAEEDGAEEDGDET